MPQTVPVLFDDPIASRDDTPAPVRHVVQYCRWSASGFPVAWPVWADSSRFEWACRRGGLHTLPDPRVCMLCQHWESA